jgi:hypothetical protein
MGSDLTVQVCFKDKTPLASIITLRHKGILTYKYGCSDERCHNLGSMQALFWNAITEAKTAGLREFDLGRTDLQNEGLATFKRRWGAVPSALTYFRLSSSSGQESVASFKTLGILSAHLPDSAFALAGRVLYKHAG